MPVPSLTPIWKGLLNDDSNKTSSDYSFSGVDIGDAHDKRVVIIGSVGGSGLSLDTPKINGNNFDLVCGGGGGDYTIWKKKVIAGSTADIVVPASFFGSARCIIGVVIAYPENEAPLDTAVNSASGTTSPVANDLAVAVDGFVFGWGGMVVVPSTLTGAWNGVDTPIEVADQVFESTQTVGAWLFSTTEQASTNDFTLSSGASGSKIIRTASWGPPAVDPSMLAMF